MQTVTVFTDKIMGMLKSMVVLTMQVSFRQGATISEICGFLRDWAPDAAESYHEGIVERVLVDLHHEGRVAQAGARWYLNGTRA